MIIKEGDKLLIVHRRLFEADEPRFFVGKVEACEGTLAKVTGRTWFRSLLDEVPTQKEGNRTKIISLMSGSLLIYSLPDAIDLSTARFELADDGSLWLRSKPDFELDLSESHFRHVERKVA